jgi:hypothetical protein
MTEDTGIIDSLNFLRGGIYMKEVNLRTWHRCIGIILALFVILQAGSGLLISLGDLSPSQSYAHSEPAVSSGGHEEEEAPWHEAIEFIHHGAGPAGTLYRIIIGIGILWMAISGGLIFFQIRARSTKR